MKRKIFCALTFLALGPSVYSQVGIGTKSPDKSAQLEVKASNKGVLIPRIGLTSITQQLDNTNTNVNAESLLIFNTATFSESGVSYEKGYYYWDGAKWARLVSNVELSGTLSGVTLAGEVTGPLNNTKVAKLIGKTLSDVAPKTNEVLTFDGTNWKAAKVGIDNIDKGTGTKGQVLTIGPSGEVTWKTPDKVATADLTLSGGLAFESGNGKSALLAAAGIKIADGGVTTGKIATKAVTPDKLGVPTSGGSDNAGKILTVNDAGDAVEWAKPKVGNIEGAQDLKTDANSGLQGGVEGALLKEATLSVKAGDGIAVGAAGVTIDNGDGIDFDSDGTSPNKKVIVKAGNGITVGNDGVSLGGTLNNDATITTQSDKGLVITGSTDNTKVQIKELPTDTANGEFLTVAADGTLKKKAVVTGKVYSKNETETDDVWDVEGEAKKIFQQTIEVTFNDETQANITLPANITVVHATLQNKDQASKVEVYNSIEIEGGKIAANIGISYYTLNGTYYATIRYFKNN